MGVFNAPGVKGFSPNANENIQRINLAGGRLGINQAVDQANIGHLLGTGEFGDITTRSGGNLYSGNIGGIPEGGLVGLTYQNIQDELMNSGLRQNAVANALGYAPGNINANQAFGQQSIDQAMQAMQAQGLLRNLTAGGTFGGNLGLNQDLTQSLSDFFSSGGAASDAQLGNIRGHRDALSQISASNRAQEFGEFMRQATDSFSNRGLRNTDTPAQELLGRSIDEFGRQSEIAESALNAQEFNQRMQAPFLQAQLGGQLQGQSQNNLFNILRSFSQPIGQGGFGANLFGNQNQFWSQFSPSGPAGQSISNANALIGGANPNPNLPGYTGGVQQSPSFLQTLGQSAAQSLGSSVGQGVAGGIGYGLGGGAPGARAAMGGL
jgi:hypothetical protein